MPNYEKRGSVQGSGAVVGGTPPTTTVVNASTKVLPEQPGRIAWGVKAAPGNTGVCYIAFGVAATTANGWPLDKGQEYVEPHGDSIWDGDVFAINVTAGDKVTVWSY